MSSGAEILGAAGFENRRRSRFIALRACAVLPGLGAVVFCLGEYTGRRLGLGDERHGFREQSSLFQIAIVTFRDQSSLFETKSRRIYFVQLCLD